MERTMVLLAMALILLPMASIAHAATAPLISASPNPAYPGQVVTVTVTPVGSDRTDLYVGTLNVENSIAQFSYPLNALPGSTIPVFAVDEATGAHSKMILVNFAVSSTQVSFVPLDCQTLFSTGSNGYKNPLTGAPVVSNAFVGFPNPTFNGLLAISVVIILMVLTVYGVVYLVGMAFGIERLKQFTRSEAFESIMNLIVIVAIVSGIGLFNAGIAFITGLSTSLTGSGTTQSTANSLYTDICTGYLTSSVNPDITAAAVVLGESVMYSAFSSFTVELMPNGFGGSVAPFSGIYPIVQVLTTEFGVLLSIIGITLGVILLLYIVYFLFPVFLYAGIVLRSFPWTRPAGGALIALFISFYVMFPALLYPFVYVSGTVAAGQTCAAGGIACAGNAFSALFTSVVAVDTLFTGFAGGAFLSTIEQFGQYVSAAAIEIIGIVIAFVVSFDLLEKLGDTLGAPSLSGGRHQSILSKII